jgi:hypothetical protein
MSPVEQTSISPQFLHGLPRCPARRSVIPADRDSEIQFISTTPLVSPRDAGTFDDARKLGISLSWIMIN